MIQVTVEIRQGRKVLGTGQLSGDIRVLYEIETALNEHTNYRVHFTTAPALGQVRDSSGSGLATPPITAPPLVAPPSRSSQQVEDLSKPDPFEPQ